MSNSSAAKQHDPKRVHDEFLALIEAATKFLSLARGGALARAWLARADLDALSAHGREARTSIAIMLAGDMMLSQPSSSGSTAFDRLAKARNEAPTMTKTALSALCRARFRLLQLEQTNKHRHIVVRDLMSGAVLRVVGVDDLHLPVGLRMFARVVMLEDDLCSMAGLVTPLDDAAFAVARNHMAAGGATPQANARWAEAVYAQVVRCGTLQVPGLNCDGDVDGDDDDVPEFGIEDSPVIQLARAWEALEGRKPDEALLRRTRKEVEPMFIVEALSGACIMRRMNNTSLANALERFLLVQMETLQLREQVGSAHVSLDRVTQAMDSAVRNGVPEAVRDLFASLRRRLAHGAARRPDDPAMERLLGRIQGLRAKTVAQGCTEQEALAAAEKVAELLDRHGLSLGELDFAAQPCEGTGIQTTRKRVAPMDECVPSIAAFFDCRCWIEQIPGAPLQYIFFGMRGDVAAAEYLYEMVERAFETETQAFRAGDLYISMRGDRRSASHSFQIGLAQGIIGKLKVLRKSRDAHLRTASGRDLVPVKSAIVDEEMAKLGLSLHKRPLGGSKRVLTNAYDLGEAAGQRFELTSAIAYAA